MVFFTTCRKEIKEPTNNSDGKNQIYIKIDDEEYLFEDKFINIYKNTRAKINIDGSSRMNDSLISYRFDFRYIKKQKRGGKVLFSNGLIVVEFLGKNAQIGKQQPSLLQIDYKIINKDLSNIYFLRYYPFKTNNISNTKDSIINISHLDKRNGEFVFSYNTIIFDDNDKNILKAPHKFYLKAKLNYKN